jgi:hypothetical protein
VRLGDALERNALGDVVHQGTARQEAVQRVHRPAAPAMKGRSVMFFRITG